MFPNHRKKIHEINYKVQLFQANPSNLYSNIFNDRIKYSVPCYKKKKRKEIHVPPTLKRNLQHFQAIK